MERGWCHSQPSKAFMEEIRDGPKKWRPLLAALDAGEWFR